MFIRKRIRLINLREAGNFKLIKLREFYFTCILHFTMKHLFVFVDFSKTSIVAFNQALAIAEYKDSTISICHIVSNLTDEVQGDVHRRLQPFLDIAIKKGVNINTVIEVRELLEMAMEGIISLKPALHCN